LVDLIIYLVAIIGSFMMGFIFFTVGETYFWRVKRLGAQNSAWSNLRQFKIGAPHTEHGDVFVNLEAPR
jgi:hypothetical protein